MALVEGDIDLTQNLDFYRKKPKKLLPANVKLLGREDVPKFKLNSFDDITIDTTFGSSVTISYSNNVQTVRTWTINSNNEEFRYVDIDDGENIISYNDNDLYITSSNYSTNLTTTINNTTNTTSSQFSMSYILDDDELTTWTTTKKYYTKKIKSAIDTVKRVFSLWNSRELFEEKRSLEIYQCGCGAEFLAPRDFYGCCKKCLRNEELKKKEEIYASRIKYNRIFQFRHREINDDYDYIGDEVPWDNVGESFGIPRPRSSIEARYFMLSKKNKGIHRYGIPWFQDLNQRIYDDYIDELKNGEKDYSSYLTNMGWIGIHRQTDDEEFISSLNAGNIIEIHTDADLIPANVIPDEYIEIEDAPLFRDDNTQPSITILDGSNLYWTNSDLNTMIYNA